MRHEDSRIGEPGSPAGRGGACPTPEAIFSFVEGALEGGVARRIAEHVRSCARCAGESALARAFVDSHGGPPANREDLALVLGRADETISRVTGRRAAGRRRYVVPAIVSGLAAAIVVFVAAGTFGPSPPPVPAGVEGSQNFRGKTLSLLAPIGEVSERPAAFSWSAAAGAAEYRVSIRDVTGNELASTTCESHSWNVGDDLSELRLATRYYWIVEARDRAGETVGTSAEGSFTIVPQVEASAQREGPHRWR